MVRHVILWTLPEENTPEQNRQNALQMKEKLEGLKALVSEIAAIKVIVDPLPSSSVNVMLDSSFASPEALEAYQVHPAHQQVAAFVRSVIATRHCIDYEE